MVDRKNTKYRILIDGKELQPEDRIKFDQLGVNTDSLIADIDRAAREFELQHEIIQRSIAEVARQASVVIPMTEHMRRLHEDIERQKEAEKILGISFDTHDSAGIYADMPVTQFWNEVDEAKRLQNALRNGTVNATTLERVLFHHTKKKKRGGGPKATPLDNKIEIVTGWLAVEGRQVKEDYANRVGVSVTTLWRWEKELREKKII